MPPPPRAAARWRRVIFFVLVQMLLGLVVLEVGLRLARPRHDGVKALLYSPTVATEYDDVESTEELLETSILGFHPHEVSEGFIRNSRGFRTPEVTTDPADGTHRIVVLGDSFTYSSSFVPWSRMWPTEMERRLNESLRPEAESEKPAVEVVNLGVPAVGPRFELRLWELEGARLDPDLVILGFFIGNDFSDETGRPLVPTPDGFLARHLLSYRLLRNGNRLWRHRKLLKESPEDNSGERRSEGGYELPGYAATYDPAAGYFQQRAPFLQLERDRLLLCARAHRQRFEDLFVATAEILVRLHHQVTAQGSRLLVVMIPDEFQVDPALLGEVLERFEISREQVDLDYPQERLVELFEREGIAYFDPLPALREETRRRRLYKPQDSHWNAEGNLFVGRHLADFLAEREWFVPH